MKRAAVITGRDPTTGRGIAVSVKDGIIIEILPAHDVEEAYLAPGLIDLQVNGYAGIDLNDAKLTAARVAALCGKMTGLGVTTFLPTLITAPHKALLEALSAIAEARRAEPLAARMIPGVHMEGPAVSPQDGPRGAHPAEHVRPPDLAEFTAWQEASGGLVRLVTLAPEHEETPAFIRAVTGLGVQVALGHTGASPQQIRAAAEAGATLSTHLGNGVAATLPRHPNLIWAQLADDGLTASFIADGHHLPADTFKAMLRAKGLDRALLVSDSVALAGMPPGLYRQAIGGDVEVRADGRIGIAGTPYLAGAGLPLVANLSTAMRMAGLTLAEVLKLATANPGRFVGGRGLLEPGQSADLMRFSMDKPGAALRPKMVWSGGEEVFSA